MFRLKGILLIGSVMLMATSELGPHQVGAVALAGKVRTGRNPVAFTGSHRHPQQRANADLDIGVISHSLLPQTSSQQLRRRGANVNSPSGTSGSGNNRLILRSVATGGNSERNVGAPLASFSALGDTDQTGGTGRGGGSVIRGHGEYSIALGTSGGGGPNFNTAAAAASGPGGAFPAFDSSAMDEVITAVIGKPAFLPCAVTNLGDRTVSWIRRKDLNVLSVGLARYTQDPRFSVIHTAGSDLWTLQLAYPTADDSGVYECQVGTLPKISRQVTLNVIARSAKISGGPQLYVNTGSVLNLTCVLSGDGILAYVGHHNKNHTNQHQQHQQNQLSGGSLASTKRLDDLSGSGRSSVNKAKDHTNSISSSSGSGSRARKNSKEGNVFHVFWYHNGAVLNYDRSARVHRFRHWRLARRWGLCLNY
ncbi:uncharacterized protein LOC111254554 isoform X2 [Varroa destructor]|uniref:Ig-like domain-containing protein n=1 Tax=Varroa destructor TaxID=109461 RepID=A0A7M7KZ61_VARDE|nr:uncharacterized protein LOC111254554 isoform X2 [Varroa destructor]